MEEASASAQNRQHETAAAAPVARAASAPVPIADALKHPDVRVCLLAAVSEIGATLRSRGTDFTCTLRIVDASRMSGISATFFAQDPAQLPCVKSSGDVINLRNVMVAKHGDTHFVKYNKNHSSFALFESNVSTQCSSYQTSEKYNGSQDDTENLTQMRMWISNNPLGPKDNELQLKSLKSDSTFDLVCKVLHVVRENSRWIFYVWDGTDTPAAELQTISDVEAVQTLPLFEGPELPREVLRTMPCVGTVLRISSDRLFKQVSHMDNSAYWVRFWNITCNQEFGIWKGNVLASSGVRLLSDKDGSVVDRLKMYDSRSTNVYRRRPMASVPSNIAGVHLEYKKSPYTTLMESLTFHEVPHMFKTLVRVVAACPCRASELCLPATDKICFRLILEDPTTRINAYVHSDDMGDFFGRFPTLEGMLRKVSKLLGVTEPDSEEVAPLTRNPPWIWCVLKSYYLDKNNPESLSYRVFATEIRD